MKIDPISLILDGNIDPEKKFFFITGNEITLIEKIKDILIKDSKDKNTVKIERIKNIDSKTNDNELFENSKLFIVDELGKIDKEKIDKISLNENMYLFSFENSPKVKTAKNIFLKRDDSYVVECYG